MAVSRVGLSGAQRRKPSPSTVRHVRRGMERDGVVRLHGLFPPALLKRLRADVMRRHRSGQLRRRGLVRDIGGRYAAVLPFEGPFLEAGFYAQPALHQLLSALLGSDYCIGSLEAVISEPGAYEQHLHMDGPLRFDRVLGGKKKGYSRDLSDLPPYAVTLCVPLCDLDEDNGPTALWPGSHRTALLPKVPSEAAVMRRFPVEQMAGKLGNCFLFDYRIFHCGMPNFSREPRPVLMFVFTRSWFRDPNLADVRPGVVISPRALARVPEKHRRLFQLAPAQRRPLWDAR